MRSRAEAPSRGRLARSRKPRQGKDLVCEWVFRPLAHLVVLALLQLRVPPPAVVVAGACVGLAGAVEIGRHELLAAAVLLQLKTVLDNADGQLARLSGRVTAFGRYLDSESDLLVNAALFAALGLQIGPWLALAGFLMLTLVLGVNFNLERLYRRESGESGAAMPHAEGAAAVLARVYALVYAPQDRAVEAFVDRRLRSRVPEARLAWHDPLTVGVVANFGLSPQLAALGLCLALGRPAAYVLVVLGCGLALAPLVLRRELLARRATDALRPIVAVD
jgi:phosphatidylglycerophosphate synthase